MKKQIVSIIACLGLIALCTPAFAQGRAGDDSPITRSADILRFMRSTVKEMGKALDQARKDKDPKSSSCVQSRLDDLRNVLAESEKSLQALQQAAFEKKSDIIEKEFRKIQKNNGIFEQQIRLVNECYENVNIEGGFTESLELYLGEEIQAGAGDEGAGRKANLSEPRPPIYEPEPVSTSSE